MSDQGARSCTRIPVRIIYIKKLEIYIHCIFIVLLSDPCKLKHFNGKNVLFLGCSEMLMANAVAEEAAVTAGKEARAMESFANALRNMPAIIAENGGYDSAQLVSELRALHKKGNKTAGLGKLRLLG